MTRIKSKYMEYFLIPLLIFLVSFLLNYFWESLHSVFLYQDHNFEAANYVTMLLYVSLIDALLVLFVYIITACVLKKIFWIKEINSKKLIIFGAIGTILAIIIEYYSVYLTARWSYNQYMPTVFGIGITPLLQLSTTGAVSILITNLLLYNRITQK